MTLTRLGYWAEAPKNVSEELAAFLEILKAEKVEK